MDKTMPDVLSDALDLIEAAKDDDFMMFDNVEGNEIE